MNAQAIAFLSGYLIAVFICLSFLISSVLFRFGVSVTPMTIYLSGLLAIGTGYDVARRYFTFKSFLLSLGIFFAAVSLSCMISLFFPDVSWDGQTYHQETVIQLAQGWNPYLHQLTAHNAPEKALFLLSNHFAKASEITEAGIYTVTHLIESGKSLNLLWIIAAFCFTLSCLTALKRFTFREAMGLSLLAAFNPVSISQSLTFYVDGNLSSVFLCILGLLCLLYLEQRIDVAIVLVLMGAFLINIKFTGLVYFCIGFSGFMLMVLLKRQTSLFKKSLIIFICSLGLGILICGYSPYVTNYKEHHHPFYPVMGEKTSDTLENDKPNSKRFLQMNSLERFAVSLFSEGSIYDVKIKIPFTTNRNELHFYTYPDLRLGGFGPLFGGILILTLILFLGSLDRFKENSILYSTVAVIGISAIINPAAWWARFVPQFWLVPIGIAIFTVSKAKWFRPLRQLVLLFLLFNIGMIAISSVAQKLQDRQALDAQLNELAKRQVPLQVDFGIFRSSRVRLKEHGLSFVEEPGLLDSNSIKLYMSETRLRVPSINIVGTPHNLGVSE